MPKLKYIFISLLTVAIIAAAMIPVAVYAYFDRPGPLEAKKYVTIPRGKSAAQIGYILADHNVIENPRMFRIASITVGRKYIPKAGEFEFKEHITPHEVMKILHEGKMVNHRITIPEGLSSHEIIERIRANDKLVGEIADVDEGMLKPDTYFFLRGDSRASVLKRMQSGHSKMVDALWEKRDKTAISKYIKTKDEAIILASMVEKEAGNHAEKGMIASVFYNRLEAKMRLQSDPTVIYAMTEGKRDLGRALTRKDLWFESPYNTYRNKGLPPKPICNPGRKSLEAVLNPPGTEYFYFVANGRDGHFFAKTLDEHNDNVRKYKRILRGDKDMQTSMR